jgi:hypothetical protein
MVRYYGAYSVRRRAFWREKGILEHKAPEPPKPEEPLPPTPERLRAMGRRWADLLRRIWDVDVLSCPKCGSKMSLLAFTLDPAVIASTLRRVRAKGIDPRAGPWAERAPPDLESSSSG